MHDNRKQVVGMLNETTRVLDFRKYKDLPCRWAINITFNKSLERDHHTPRIRKGGQNKEILSTAEPFLSANPRDHKQSLLIADGLLPREQLGNEIQRNPEKPTQP